MIKVNSNKVDLDGNTDDIAVDFICLCVVLLNHFSMIYPGKEEDLLKEMLEAAFKTHSKFSIKEEK